ncbi:hypothetical protein F5I97DRAFT_1832631 [Phlebopus sp. FC_14]|nr:hypothetical protein F5I97DRAFT_1832631 [Phlebopus sp. FC_14]
MCPGQQLKKSTGLVKSRDGDHSLQAGILTDEEIQFIEGCLEHSPDAYLDEIQQQLAEATDCHVSTATIWQTLQKLNYSHKIYKLTNPHISKSAMERKELHCLYYMYKISWAV